MLGLIDRYRSFLPVKESTKIITLGEGNTPLVPVDRFAQAMGISASVFVKLEGSNPTGSFKDRGMTMAVTKAAEEGSVAVMCASTGNTAASAAAYAARAGLTSIVLLAEGKTAMGKLAQAVQHGAKVVQIQGNFDDALRIVREITEKHPIALVNSVNPFRIEGQKTGAFEICDVLGNAPDYLAIPVGNAGNITAYWKGFQEYQAAGRSTRLPRCLGFQAAGAAPIVEGRPVAKPETIATAIRIGNPASWQGATAARDESNGLIDKVTDEEILEAYRQLALHEGLFCEPASAASLAGVVSLARRGWFRPGEQIVCILTGHGLKDPDTALKTSNAQAITVPAQTDAVEELLVGSAR